MTFSDLGFGFRLQQLKRQLCRPDRAPVPAMGWRGEGAGAAQTSGSTAAVTDASASSSSSEPELTTDHTKSEVLMQHVQCFEQKGG